MSRKTVMADDDADFEDEPDIEEEVDLADDVDLELDDDAEADDDVEELLDVEPLEVADVPVVVTPTAPAEETTDDEEDDVVDLEEELHPDDVEEPLDVLLHERTKADRLEEEANDLEDEDLEPDEKGDVSTRGRPSP